MRILAIFIGAVVVVLASYVIAWQTSVGNIIYVDESSALVATTSIEEIIPNKIYHISTPNAVKAVYLSSWAAGNEKFRTHLFDLLDNTEINSVIIDVKDYSGRISFVMNDPMIKATGASENRIVDIVDFINQLHEKGAYVIGRISSFQDSYLVNVHPEWAVKTKTGDVWKDYKGVKWLDPGAPPVWDYLVAIGNEAYSVGFDELNFDYIRYPSDGKMSDIAYSWSEGRTRQEVMRSFYVHLREAFASTSVPISIDLFGLTTSVDDDLGIGQNLVDALQYFDYVAPMVYPSHFAKGFIGYAKPAEHPYEVIKYSMDQAIKRSVIASSSPEKIRPWLQAFDLGAVYTPALVRAQIQATYDAGLTSWMLWDAANIYDKNDLMVKENSL
ncbi:MAG: putative glycoside hydrolase [Candidatus Paceibacterota bacterium]